MFAGMHHVPNVERAIEASKRILRSGGIFVAFEPNNECWYRRPMLPLKNLLRLYTDDERFLRPSEVLRMMDERGFREVKIAYTSPEYNPEHLSSTVNKLLAKFIHIASSMSPEPRWQTFFIIRGIKE